MSKTVVRSTPAEGTGDIKNWHALVILAALVFFFFKDILLGKAYFWEDFLYYSYPIRNFAATTLANGEFPLWNPYTFSGMPFFADMTTTVLYLPCLVLTLFVRDGYLSFYWLQLLIILHYALAGITMFYFARSFGLKNLPSLFSGIAFTFSSYMILHVIHQHFITTIAWWPLVLLLFRKALAEERWFHVFLAALVLGHAILAGHPQLTLYFFFFLLFFFLFELLSAHRGRALLSRGAAMMTAKAALVVTAAVAITAVQLLPTLELSEVSKQAAITYEKATEGQMSWSHLLTPLFPKFFGAAMANDYRYWGPGTYWYYWENCVYFGALPLLLTLMSAFLWKSTGAIPFFWSVSLFALLYAVGDNFFVHGVLYNLVPGFSRFRAPARMLALMNLAVALLSGFSLQHLLFGGAGKTIVRWRRMILLALGVAAGLWTMIVSGSLAGIFDFMKNQSILHLVKQEANVSIAFFLAAGALLLVLLKRSGRRSWPGVALVALLFVDLLVFGGRQNTSTVNPTEYFRRSENLVHFLRQEGALEYFRINTRNENGMLMDRNQGMMDRVFMMEGYSPLVLRWTHAPFTDEDRSLDLLNIKYRTITNTAQRSLSLQPRTTYMPRAFFVYELRIVTKEQELVSLLNADTFDYRRIALVEKDSGRKLHPPAVTPRWKATITEYRQNGMRLDVETPLDGFLVLSEIYYNGWNAYVDGVRTEVFKTNYNLRGLFVPAGARTVEVRFEPPLAMGVLTSMGVLMVCITGMTLSRKRARSADDAHSS